MSTDADVSIRSDHDLLLLSPLALLRHAALVTATQLRRCEERFPGAEEAVRREQAYIAELRERLESYRRHIETMEQNP